MLGILPCVLSENHYTDIHACMFTCYNVIKGDCIMKNTVRLSFDIPENEHLALKKFKI